MNLKIAAIDIGTNSCRLLIADINKNQQLIPLQRDLMQTRLGQGLSANGSINDEAVKRTIACLSRFTDIINQHKVTALRAVATSAVREANNREIFLQTMLQYFPSPIDIIDGEQEALLTYQGVKRGLNIAQHPVVIDLGGGSTEIILDNKAAYIKSLPLGAVRATESHMSIRDMKKILKEGMGDISKLIEHPLVFVGGTATSLAAIKMEMRTYRPELIHGQVMSIGEVNRLCDSLFQTSLEQRKRIPGLQPERADILPQGVRIISLIMSCLEAEEMIVSESDLLEGVIWNLFERPGRSEAAWSQRSIGKIIEN